MSRQRIFDESAAHLLAQQDSAMLDGVGHYRLPDGNCCPVGYWISEACYLPEWDELQPRRRSNAIGKLLLDPEQGPRLSAALAQRGVDARDEMTVAMLADLQHAHDNARNLAFQDLRANCAIICSSRKQYLTARLAMIARNYQLSFLEQATLAPAQPAGGPALLTPCASSDEKVC